MTDPLSARLSELLAKATPGPWHALTQCIDENVAANSELCLEAINALPQLLAERAALNARVEEARGALRTIADGDEPRPIGKAWRNDGKPSKNDKCVHDRWMYEDCGECVAEVARAYLTKETSDGEG